MYLSTMAGAVEPTELTMYAALLMDSSNSEMIEFLMAGMWILLRNGENRKVLGSSFNPQAGGGAMVKNIAHKLNDAITLHEIHDQAQEKAALIKEQVRRHTGRTRNHAAAPLAQQKCTTTITSPCLCCAAHVCVQVEHQREAEREHKARRERRLAEGKDPDGSSTEEEEEQQQQQLDEEGEQQLAGEALDEAQLQEGLEGLEAGEEQAGGEPGAEGGEGALPGEGGGEDGAGADVADPFGLGEGGEGGEGQPGGAGEEGGDGAAAAEARAGSAGSQRSSQGAGGGAAGDSSRKSTPRRESGTVEQLGTQVPAAGLGASEGGKDADGHNLPRGGGEEGGAPDYAPNSRSKVKKAAGDLASRVRSPVWRLSPEPATCPRPVLLHTVKTPPLVTRAAPHAEQEGAGRALQEAAQRQLGPRDARDGGRVVAAGHAGAGRHRAGHRHPRAQAVRVPRRIHLPLHDRGEPGWGGDVAHASRWWWAAAHSG